MRLPRLGLTLLALSLAACGTAGASETGTTSTGTGIAGTTEASTGDPAIQSAFLELEFTAKLGGKPLEFGVEGIDRYGQRLIFQQLGYVVAGLSAEIVEGEPAVLAIAATPQTVQAASSLLGPFELPAGSFTALSLELGHSPTQSPTPSLYATGLFTADEQAGEFLVHLTSGLKSRRLEARLATPLTLEAGQSLRLGIEVELDRLFAGVRLSDTPRLHTAEAGSPGERTFANFSRTFRLVAGGQVSAFELQLADEDQLPDDPGKAKDTRPPVFAAAPIHSESLACDLPESPCFVGFGPNAALGWRYVVTHDSPVYALAHSTITRVSFSHHDHTHHQDIYNIEAQAHENSAFTVEYHGLSPALVQEGQVVTAGQPLGRAAQLIDPTHALVDVRVHRLQELDQYLCPESYVQQDALDTLRNLHAHAHSLQPQLVSTEACTAIALACDPRHQPCTSDSTRLPHYGDLDAGRRTFTVACRDCHGPATQMSIAGPLCARPECGCASCGTHTTLAPRIARDMPPEGTCMGSCAADVAAYILAEE